MNYFELYELPIQLKVDAVILKQKLYSLSRKYHPDFFTNESEEEQTRVVEISSIVNKAFKTFSNLNETIKYVLQLKGLLIEEEKYELSPMFLMEMMELSEQAMEAKMDGEKDTIDNVLKQIATKENEIYEPVKQIVETYTEGITTQKELLQVKEYYYQQKYLSRILAGIK